MTHSVDTKSIVNVLHVVANRAAVGGNQKTVYFVGDEIAQVHDSLGTGEWSEVWTESIEGSIETGVRWLQVSELVNEPLE